MVTIRQYSVAAFREYLRGYRERGAVIKCSFLHHTWKPTAAQYRGKSTILGIRRAHLARGFSDIACNAYACPDETVFNARPPSVGNCACQYPDEGSSTWPKALRDLSGGSKRWMNAYGFGLETIGNFDSEDPAQSVAMHTSLDVLAAVHDLWSIPVAHCFFHRDVSTKTCPGERVTKTWVHAELRKRLAGGGPLKVVLLPPTAAHPHGEVIDCAPQVEDGTTRADLRPLAEALGYTVTPHLERDRLYLKRKED